MAENDVCPECSQPMTKTWGRPACYNDDCSVQKGACAHDASYSNGDGTRTCLLARCGEVFTAAQPGAEQSP